MTRTPLQRFLEFDEECKRMWGTLLATVGSSATDQVLTVYYGQQPLYTIGPEERAASLRLVHLMRFLQAMSGFEEFFRSLFGIAEVHGVTQLGESRLRRLATGGPKRNIWTELNEHLHVDLAEGEYDYSAYACKRPINPTRLVEYVRVRHRWMHQAGFIDTAFLCDEVPTLSGDGWFEATNRCWVDSEPAMCRGPLEQVVRDVKIVAIWVAQEWERLHPELQERIAGYDSAHRLPVRVEQGAQNV